MRPWTAGSGGLIPRGDPARRERAIAALLFFVTCCTVFWVYLLQWQVEPVFSGPGPTSRALTFTATLMGILLAHELGHFGTARAHGFRLSLPWFLPAPFLVGTFGAIIRLEGRPRDRTGLLEMGAMGPIAGVVAVIAVMVARLLMGANEIPEGGLLLGRPLLWWVLSALLTGQAAEPISTQDPMAFGAWIGCLLTALNLLPVGQLDGGHIAHAMWPDRSEWIARGVVLALLLAGWLWIGWWVWALVLYFVAWGPPMEVRDLRTPPTRRAQILAGLCGAAFLLCVLPQPI